MNVKIRYGFFIAFLIFVHGFFAAETAWAVDAGTFAKLWEELNNGTASITVTANLTGPMEDEDQEKIDFVLEEILSDPDGITLDVNGRTLKYNSAAYNPDAENPPEAYVFRIDIGGGKLTVNKADIQNGYSDSGIFYVEDGSLIFSDTTNFSNNYSEDSGSVAYLITGFEGSTLEFQGVTTMTSNTAESDGGALALIGQGTTLLAKKEITFTSNVSRDGGGGALYGAGIGVTFEDTFSAKSNEAETYGGAVLLENESTAIFNGTTTFESNTVNYGDGGALYASSASTITFNGNTTFKGNKAVAGFGGGAIYGDLESKFTFKAGTTVSFESNQAVAGDGFTPGGGAVYLVSSGAPTNVDVEYGWTMDATASFTKNAAAGSGGAIYAEASALKFAGVDFLNNTSGFSGEDEPGGGGAIYADMDSYLYFSQTSKFENNEATSGSGGAIFADMVMLFDFEDTVTFKENKAVSGYGGAVYLSGSGSADMENPVTAMRFRNGSTFTGNSAADGGAFYLNDSTITFGGQTTIAENKATGNGGAFYIQGESMLHFESGSASITGNTATGKGGAVFVDEDSILNIKLGGLTGASSATVEIGTEKTANDGIYLSAGSSLNINAGAGSRLTVHSALSGADWNEGETNLNVSGPGTVELKGNTEGFKGHILVEQQGTLVLDRGSVSIGDLYESTVEIIDGGTLLVLIDQEGDKAADARVRANSLTIDDGKFEFDVKNFIMNAEEEAAIGDGFALITLLDPDADPDADPDEVTAVYELLAQYIEDGLIDRENSAHFSHNIVTDATTGTTTLYVYVVFDPETMEWTFNVANGKQELDKTLDNSMPIAYDGAVTINGNGTLVLTTPENRITSLEGNGNLEFDGTLYVNGKGVAAGETRKFNGNLSGSGTFIKEGGFTQSLLGNSQGDDTQDGFTGNFEVREGTLIGNTNSLRNKIDVEKDAVLVFDQATIVDLESEPERTFDGTLTGQGAVEIYGENNIANPLTDEISDSVLKINRDNSGFEGTVFVDRGWLLVEGGNGNLSGASMITIGSNGGLGGGGTVGNVTVTKGGALQAYNGSLDIAGDLKLESESITYTILDGKGTDRILVGGSLTVEKTSTVRIVDVTNDFQLNLFSLADIFVTEDEDVAWQNFAIPDYTDDDGNVWRFSIGADGGVSGKIVGRDEPVRVGLSRNQALVAHALDTIRPLDTTSQEMKNFIAKLESLKSIDADGNTVYDPKYLEATKELAGAVRANGLQLGLYSPFRTVFNRLSLGSDLYGGSPVIYNNGYGPISGLESRGAGAGPITYRGQMDPVNPHFDGCAPMCDIPCMMGENNFWADVTHIQTKTKGDANSDEYGISRTGLLIGMDFQKRVDSRIGMLFGYFAPYLWQNADRVEADDYHGGLYFHKNHLGTDLYGYFGYAHQEYRSRRLVNMRKIDAADYGEERYDGKTRGDSFNFSLELSKPRYYGHCYVLRPLIAVDYYYTEQKGYAESGPTDGLFGLRYDKAKYDQWFVRIGMNLKKEGAYSTTVMRLQYINQFGENAYPDANARFLYTGAPTMNVRGVDLRRDYLNVGFGFNLFMNEARSKFVSFDYDFNTSRRTQSHAFSLVLVERF